MRESSLNAYTKTHQFPPESQFLSLSLPPDPQELIPERYICVGYMLHTQPRVRELPFHVRHMSHHLPQKCYFTCLLVFETVAVAGSPEIGVSDIFGWGKKKKKKRKKHVRYRSIASMRQAGEPRDLRLVLLSQTCMHTQKKNLVVKEYLRGSSTCRYFASYKVILNAL